MKSSMGVDFAALAHGNDESAAALLDAGANAARVISLVSEEDLGIGRSCIHHEIV
jgi:hypothetical protein